MELKDKIYNDYQNILFNIEESDIKKQELGFINNNCNSIILSILIHALQNIDIFTNEQLANINFMLNKITYGN